MIIAFFCRLFFFLFVLFSIAWKILYQSHTQVHGVCGENTIGYVQIPVGVAGPLLVDDEETHVPLGTTEGALIASVNRGCKALSVGGGVRTVIVEDGMTRAPALRLPSLRRANEGLSSS